MTRSTSSRRRPMSSPRSCMRERLLRLLHGLDEFVIALSTSAGRAGAASACGDCSPDAVLAAPAGMEGPAAPVRRPGKRPGRSGAGAGLQARRRPDARACSQSRRLAARSTSRQPNGRDVAEGAAAPAVPSSGDQLSRLSAANSASSAASSRTRIFRQRHAHSLHLVEPLHDLEVELVAIFRLVLHLRQQQPDFRLERFEGHARSSRHVLARTYQAGIGAASANAPSRP